MPFEAMVENPPYFCERPPETTSIWSKSLARKIPWICVVRGMVADIEEMKGVDTSELHARRLNSKEVSTPMKGEKFTFPVADGTVKISVRDSPDREGEQDNLRRESDGFSSTPGQDSSWCDGEAKSDFWSISGDFN